MIQATENLPFGNLLLQRFPLHIPKYQRAYAWDEEEIDDFIRDINDLYNMRMNNPGERMPHFFGGVVSVKRTAGGTYTGNEYDIVDGQQRLTTITLALNALLSGLNDVSLEAMQKNDPDSSKIANAHSDVIHNKYIVYPEVEGVTVRYHNRIRLSKADNSFFTQILENTGTARTQNQFQRDSHRRIQQAWRKIYTDVVDKPIVNNASLSTLEKVERLLAIHSCLTEDCYIIHIISDNHQEAYRLFSILNDRGKNLSDGDLLRSSTLEMLESFTSQQSQIEESWDNILGYTDLQIDHFLRAYYPSHQGKRGPQRDLANAYRTTFFNYNLSGKDIIKESDANNLRDRILQMERESIAFAEIIEGRWPYQNSSFSAWDRERLPRLIKILKHTICLPLLMSAHECLPESQFAEIVSLLERFSFRYITIVGAHAGRLGNLYNEQAKEIRMNPASYQITKLRTGLYDLQEKHAKDTTFSNGLIDQLNYSNQSMRIIIRYFLSTLEDYYKWYQQGAAGKPNPDKMRLFDINTLTIEHIHPQSPKIPDQSLDPKVHHIGNLSFWGAQDNQSAGNNIFSDKRKLYQQSSVALNRELFNVTNWDINEFNKRQNKLLKMALAIFSA